MPKELAIPSLQSASLWGTLASNGQFDHKDGFTTFLRLAFATFVMVFPGPIGSNWSCWTNYSIHVQSQAIPNLCLLSVFGFALPLPSLPLPLSNCLPLLSLYFALPTFPHPMTSPGPLPWALVTAAISFSYKCTPRRIQTLILQNPLKDLAVLCARGHSELNLAFERLCESSNRRCQHQLLRKWLTTLPTFEAAAAASVRQRLGQLVLSSLRCEDSTEGLVQPLLHQNFQKVAS